MIVITYQRAKCIGCNYCVEMDPDNWRMTKKDGKSVLLASTNKKGFHTLRLNTDDYDHHLRVSEACPVGIIRVDDI